MPTPTPHISAAPGDFAEAILLPGDPLRAKHIAEHHLDDAREVTAVRNVLGYTGSYRDMPVSVMGTGMGIPSASIYSSELITEYGVKRLVRVGSCGAVQDHVQLRDVILAVGACTDSQVNRARYGGLDFAATADFGLLRTAAEAAEAAGLPYRAGNVHSSDLFYDPRAATGYFDRMNAMGVLAVEMEAAGIYGVAAENGARALTVLTVSDHIRSGEATTSDERQTTFDDMVRIALDGLVLDAERATA
ncbi:purine-nucleoside phosphorylase [Egicoccus halophilus]|uniref:Uridine phosphorylase n=1 Tax=Egicoccus halophilus TaxID=1670830 RepID=A0A8J3ADE4_9ACTN|nr:purine-nucleoside phosphorylase [Egicoccus halophilus]GGI09804.1 purine nucleoside phosphorylase DeoD-type [Egicoccus halophilus]